MINGASGFRLGLQDCISTTDAIMRALAGITSLNDIASFMSDLTHDLRFRHCARIHHNDLCASPTHGVDTRQYLTEAS